MKKMGGLGFRRITRPGLAACVVLGILTVTDVRAAAPVITEGGHTNVVMDEDGDPVGFSLQLHAVDDDGDALSWEIGFTPANGTVHLTPTTGTVVDVNYQPDPDYNGLDSFTVRVVDTDLGSDEMSVDVSLLPQNDPPRLTANDTLRVYQTQTKLIATNLLSAMDIDTNDASQLIFTLGPEIPGSPVQVGELRFDGASVTGGTQVTLADIEAERLTYTAPITDQGLDSFAFTVQDAEGALASDSGFSVFTFRIQIIFTNFPPVALNGSADSAMGATVEETFRATDTNLPPQELTFRIVQDGVLGHAEILNATSGTFRYTHAGGAAGTDTIQFQVSDGLSDSLLPGLFEITSANYPPVAQPLSIVSVDGQTVAANLSAEDPDLPAQTLTFNIITNGSRGTATMDPTTGAFTYTPIEGRFGTDRFWVSVNDGQTSSAPVDVAVAITHIPVEGDLILTGSVAAPGGGRFAGIFVVDSRHGDAGAVTWGGSLTEPNAVVYDPVRQRLYSTDASMANPVTPRVIETNPRSGTQRIVSEGGMLLYPYGIGVGADGQLLVSDLAGSKVLRIDPQTGAQSVVAAGGNLVAPSGLEVLEDGTILVLDAQDVQAPDGMLIHIDPTDGTQMVLSSNQNFVVPVDLCTSASGMVYVTDMAGILIRVNPTDGTQTVVDSGLQMPIGLATTGGRHLYYCSAASGGPIYRLDSDTDTPSVFLPGEMLNADLRALATVPPMGWIRGVSAGTNGTTLTWHTVTSQTYRIESRTNLISGEWTHEMEVTGSGGWFHQQVPGRRGNQRFYRCLPVP